MCLLSGGDFGDGAIMWTITILFFSLSISFLVYLACNFLEILFLFSVIVNLCLFAPRADIFPFSRFTSQAGMKKVS
jgi:hypothetical protein